MFFLKKTIHPNGATVRDLSDKIISLELANYSALVELFIRSGRGVQFWATYSVELLLQDGGHPTLSFTYFEPDSNKDGGRYLTRIGIVKKIDTFAKNMILYGSDDIENKKIPTIDIPLDGIIDISGFPTEFDEYKN